MNSTAMRQTLRRRRRSIPPEERASAAIAVADILVTRPLFMRARHMAFYMASDGELDPMPLMIAAARRQKQCYLPVMTDLLLGWRSSPLAFQHFDPLTDSLVTNRYNILEPAFDPHRLRAIGMLDIIFMPLVGFDRQGNRIGMGKGFYDRALGSIDRWFRRPKLVGIAYSQQEVENIEPDAWDVGLDAIVTEKGWLAARQMAG